MNILHLIDSPHKGGAEILALDIFRNSKKHNLNITLVTTRKGELDLEFRSSGVNFYLIERRMPIDLKLVFRLKKIVDENGIKIIHTHQAIEGLHAYLTKLLTNVKIVMSFHGHAISKKNDLVLKFLIPRMDANIAVSNSFLNRLKKEIKFNTDRNFHVIHNGIDTKKFFKTDRNFRRELKLSDSDLLLGMVGNFNNDGRDHITVCKALPFIFKKYPNLHFVFVGRRAEESPQYYDECIDFCSESKILNKTHFVGSRSDINNVLNSLDVFVYSSNHDSFGIAVIEAMIAGLPVIINDLSTLMEITNNGKYAMVFESKNSGDLENKIIELIENKGKRDQLADEGKEWALSQFSIEKHISNLKNLYNSL